MRKILLLLGVIPVMAIAQKQDSIFIRKLANEILLHSTAYENLRHLTKNIGGRLAGSPQMITAENWGAEAWRAAGADTIFLQECMVPHWVRGGTDKASIVSVNGERHKKSLDITALGNSLGTGKKGLAAEVIALASFDELEKRKDEVKGKIVFFNYAFNPTNIRPGTSYGDAGLYRRNGPSQAAKYGAIACITRSLSEANNNNPHTGATKYNDTFPKIPAAAIGLEDADYLWKACRSNTSVKMSMYTYGYFMPDAVGHNVIAELKGSGKEVKYISVGGHLDSWDVNEGAHDDGTGVVQTIEVLRALKALGYKPANTIRFVLFANEENGLRGGKKYASNAKAKNEQHVFALESDGGGFSPRGFSFKMNTDKISNIQPWVDLLKPYGVYDLSAGGGGADVSELNDSLHTPVAELIPDGQRYFDVHHSRGDVFEAVNKREMLLGAVNMAALIYLVDKHGL